MHLRTMLLAVTMMVASPSNPALASTDPQPAWLASGDEGSVVSEVEAVMAERQIPGVQVVIVFPDGRTWQRSFGVRDLASGSPMSDGTLLQAGSVTKVFTASLLADLVAEGSLRWSDTVAERLPGIPMRPEIAALTIDALATHTSGLPANPPNRVDIDGVMQPYSVAQLYASLSDASFTLEEPGRNYSNWGFAILGHIVEKVTGARFEAALRTRIFDPLAMKDSTIALSPRDERRLAVHYWPEDAPRVPRPRWVFGEVAGFGGITSTAGDLAKFLAYQIRPGERPEVLDAAQVQSLRDVRVLLPSWSAGGGRSWLVVRDRESGTITIEHSGEVDGHSSYIGFSPANGAGIAVMANLGGSSARRIALPVLARATNIARSHRAANREEALLLARTRQWSDAETALAKVVAASPGDGEAWHQLGVARYGLRDLAGAGIALTRAEATAPKPAGTVFLLARIAASQQRIDDAFALLDRAVELDPGEIDLELAELRALHPDARWSALARKYGTMRRASSTKAIDD